MTEYETTKRKQKDHWILHGRDQQIAISRSVGGGSKPQFHLWISSTCIRLFINFKDEKKVVRKTNLKKNQAQTNTIQYKIVQCIQKPISHTTTLWMQVIPLLWPLCISLLLAKNKDLKGWIKMDSWGHQLAVWSEWVVVVACSIQRRLIYRDMMRCELECCVYASSFAAVFFGKKEVV